MNKQALDYTRTYHPHLIKTLEPLMDHSPVSGFVYMELLGATDFFFLASDPRWGEEYLMRGSPGETWIEGLKFAATQDQPTHITWSFFVSPDPIEQYCADLGYRYGANIYKKEGNTIRLWAFNGVDPNSLLFFQTQKTILEDFIFYFEDQKNRFLTKESLQQGIAHWAFPLNLTAQPQNIPSIPEPRYLILHGQRGSVKLTPRQWQILKIAAQGLSMKEIGRILGISHRTVDYALQVVKAKSGLYTRDQLNELVRLNSLHK